MKSTTTCTSANARRSRSHRLTHKGCLVPLMTRLAAKQKIGRRRIPLSNITKTNSREEIPMPPLSNATDEYIRDKLALFKDSLYSGLHNVRYTNPPQGSNVLPKQMEIMMIDNVDSVCPTHMLAVYSPKPNPTPNVKPKITLYPAHEIVLSSHCSRLPRLPESESTTSASTTTSTIPVVPLALPSPTMYPYLQTYLYTKDISMLENTLLPSSSHLPLETSILMAQLAATRGLWANATALGVVDTGLYEMMDRVGRKIQYTMAVLACSRSSSTSTGLSTSA